MHARGTTVVPEPSRLQHRISDDPYHHPHSLHFILRRHDGVESVALLPSPVLQTAT